MSLYVKVSVRAQSKIIVLDLFYLLWCNVTCLGSHIYKKKSVSCHGFWPYSKWHGEGREKMTKYGIGGRELKKYNFVNDVLSK